MLSVPAAFVATAVYRFLLLLAARKYHWVSRFFRPVSYAVLVLFGLELMLLIKFGAVSSRELVGPGFYALHLAVFFLGIPALANLLLLRTQPKEWFIVLPLCAAFALILVLLQYDVSERLYGINGNDGPYSNVICFPQRQST
jgi:hypothetical protein